MTEIDHGSDATGPSVQVRIGDDVPAAAAPRRLVAALLAVALVGALLAVLFAQRAGAVRDEPAAPAAQAGAVGPGDPATTELTRAVTAAMATLWSYDYRRLDELPAQVAAVSTPEFQAGYDAVFARIRELAPATKAVVAASVQHLGVVRLTSDTAELLVYLDQAASKDGGRPVGAGARLRVEAVKVDGVWRIDAVTPF
ncbi:nuclear transport factor 2 family protein [Nocardioides sp.]|uniref:nuclear transport factor 2 family protein n=1 Tax=Nocardioides sp. TaxID=35761 RepID=UPI0035175BB6